MIVDYCVLTKWVRCVFGWVVFAFGCVKSYSAPIVSNLEVEQNQETNLVDIRFDLSHTRGLPSSIAVEGRFRPSEEWVSLQQLSGDVGDAVAPGENLHIVWDADADMTSKLISEVQIRVIADDGVIVPNGFVELLPGSFQMGLPDGASPFVANSDYIISGAPDGTNSVTLYYGYYISETEVTGGLWNEVRQWGLENGYVDLASGEVSASNDGDDDLLPVSYVSWWDVLKWCNARSEKDGRSPVFVNQEGDPIRSGGELSELVVAWGNNGYSLPTEAEWEYASRAATNTDFYTGDLNEGNADPGDPNLLAAGWYAENSESMSYTVASKEKNAWDLYDFHGNVWEWCLDGYIDFTENNIWNPLAWPSVGTDNLRMTVVRGGSWKEGALAARSGSRAAVNIAPLGVDAEGYEDIGFRTVLRLETANFTLRDERPLARAGVDQSAFDDDADGFESFLLDGSESSDDRSIAVWSWSWGSNGAAVGETAEVAFPIGETVVTLTTSDDRGNIDTDTVTVTVLEASILVASAGDDIGVVDTDGNGLEIVTLDSSGSLSNRGLSVITWSWSSGQSVVGASQTAEFPTGNTIVTLTLEDVEGNIGTDTMMVVVATNAEMTAGNSTYQNFCVSCHREDGNGYQDSVAPSLGGLGTNYLRDQIRDFKNRERGFDDVGSEMSQYAMLIENNQIRAFTRFIVASFEGNKQPQTIFDGDPVNGASLYESCIDCHGSLAQGDNENPQLYKQHDWYLFSQLRKFKSGIRPKGAGSHHTLESEQAMKDVVAYIQSLGE